MLVQGRFMTPQLRALLFHLAIVMASWSTISGAGADDDTASEDASDEIISTVEECERLVSRNAAGEQLEPEEGMRFFACFFNDENQGGFEGFQVYQPTPDLYDFQQGPGLSIGGAV